MSKPNKEFEPEAYAESIKDDLIDPNGEYAIDNVLIRADGGISHGEIHVIIYYGTKKPVHICDWKCTQITHTKRSMIVFGEEGFSDLHRYVCPCCVDHPQTTEDKSCGCKNTFLSGKAIVGQCGCYSEVHGKRD